MKEDEKLGGKENPCDFTDPREALRVLFEDAPYGIFIISPEGRLLALNPRGIQITGYAGSELPGMNVADLIPAEDLARDPIPMENLARGGIVVGERRLRRKDGRIIWVEHRSRLLPEGNILCIAIDITARKQAETVLDQKTRELSALHALGLAVNTSLSLEETLSAALKGMQEAVRPDLALLFLLQGERLLLRQTLSAEELPGMGAVLEHRLGECICGQAVREGRPVYSPDIRVDPRCTREECKLMGVRSFAALPLRDGREIIGVVGLAALKDRDFETQAGFLETMVHQISVAPANAGLYEAARRELDERKKAEEVQARLNAILEGTSDLVSTATPEGKLNYLNRAGRKMVGWGLDEPLDGRIIADMHPAWAYVRIETEGLSAARTKGTWEGETAVLHRDGREIPVSQVILAHRSPEGVLEYFSTIMRNITERKQAEEELRRSENLLGSIYRAAPAGIGVVSNRILLTVNDRVCEMTGYRREELTGRSSRVLYPSDADFDHVGTEKYRQIREQGTGTVETRWQRKDGRIIDVLMSSTPINPQDLAAGVTFSALDITKRKQVERQLVASHRMLRDVIETIPVRVFWKDRSGRYLGCNRLFAQDTGHSLPEHLIGQDDFNLPWVELAGRYRADDREVIETGQAKINYEEPLTTREGRVMWVSTSKIPMRDGEGRTYGVLGCYEDITQRKLAEETRERLQAQLTQAQKMESVGRLAGGVAHDFNNMLGVIRGHTELALAGLDPADPLVEDLRQIQRAAEHSADLTRQLLAFARKQTVAPKLLDLNEIVGKGLEMLRRLLGENIELVWLPARDLESVKIDPSQVEQVLVNLCVNARDAIQDTGRITLETGTVTIDETYCGEHAGFLPGRYVLLAVSDNGCGMDAGTLSHLFEPFFTTKETGKGTGLGLATVYGIVKQNHGFINVYSEPGKGTTFKIYLPRHATRAEPLVEPEMRESPASGHETILLVEDEPLILNVATRMLRSHGYNVIPAGTPGEAIRLAGEHAGEIHLLMTDVIMPEMNGRFLAKRILSLYPGLRCVFMSGYTADVIAHHGMLDEGVYFLQKPFSMGDLAARIREALGSGGTSGTE